jgi:hypothetical protein
LLGEPNRRIVDKCLKYPRKKRAFVGGFGDGKTAITHSVVMGLSCTAAPGERPCGSCASCRYIFDCLKSKPFGRDRAPGGHEFALIDCTRLRAPDMKMLTDDIMVFASKPAIFVFDEFHDVDQEVQLKFLKLLEAEVACMLLFCFPYVETHLISKAILQRLSPPFIPSKPTVEEFKPLLKRIMDAEMIPLVDPEAQDQLINVCGRVPRLVLSAMEEVRDEGEGLSLAVVEMLAERLSIIGDGKEKGA